MKSNELNENKNLEIVAKAKKCFAESKKKMKRRMALAANVIVTTATSYLLMGNVALAKNPDTKTADGKWQAMINFLTPWIQKLGGVIILLGVVQFGLGFKNEDSDGMTRGMKTAIAGLIVFGVGGATDTFLA